MSTKRKAPETEDKTVKKAKSITSFFAAAPSQEKASNFNKAEWVKTLKPEQKTLLALEIGSIHDSWLAVLKDELVKPSFLNLKKFLQAEKAAGKVIYPPEKDIYSWSRHTPLNKVRVLILGQDPYHGPNQAHGLSFSVNPPTPAPPSLQNMFKALEKDYPNSFSRPPNRGGSLIPWAEQGVLMLNTCLTVRRGEANSHAKRGWEEFTQKVVEIVCSGQGRSGRGVVVMAWGQPAAKRVTAVDKKKNLVLYSVHPSPLSASRGFFDCGHFRKANEWLSEKYQFEIDWNLGPKKAPEEAPKEEEPPQGEEEFPEPSAEEEAAAIAALEAVQAEDLKTPAEAEVKKDDAKGKEEEKKDEAEKEKEKEEEKKEVKDGESNEKSAE